MSEHRPTASRSRPGRAGIRAAAFALALGAGLAAAPAAHAIIIINGHAVETHVFEGLHNDADGTPHTVHALFGLSSQGQKVQKVHDAEPTAAPSFLTTTPDDGADRHPYIALFGFAPSGICDEAVGFDDGASEPLPANGVLQFGLTAGAAAACAYDVTMSFALEGTLDRAAWEAFDPGDQLPAVLPAVLPAIRPNLIAFSFDLLPASPTSTSYTIEIVHRDSGNPVLLTQVVPAPAGLAVIALPLGWLLLRARRRGGAAA